MKATEFITEVAVGTITTGDLIVVIDDHALDRAFERGVDPRAIDYVISKRLPKILHKLDSIEGGQQFWIYDWSREVALGMRRLSSTQLKFVLKTVWPGVPSRTPNVEKIIRI